MSKIYSTYQAKAQFSEILRQVRGGQRIVVSYHGEPVAEIRPLEKADPFADRIKALQIAGVLVPSKALSPGGFQPVTPRPGALKRFLDSRG